MILLVCPCCGQEADEYFAPGLYINARLSLGSDIVQMTEQIARLPKKGAEAVLEALNARLATLKADLADLQEDVDDPDEED
jgi:hypothetical protein